jgi:hypothetical protein
MIVWRSITLEPLGSCRLLPNELSRLPETSGQIDQEQLECRRQPEGTYYFGPFVQLGMMPGHSNEQRT